MLNHCVCGCSSFHQVEEDLLDHCSTPRRSRRIGSSWKKSNNNNPYSLKGLDKFANVLADLEDKRQKIYQQMGSQDFLFIRFSYTNSNSNSNSDSEDWVPIVVKLRHQKQVKPTNTKHVDSKDKIVEQARGSGSHGRTEKNKSVSSSLGLVRRRSNYHLPMVIVLILLGLAMYNRSFAIICTSIWWYLVPKTMGEKKTQHVRKFTENKKRMMDGFSCPE